MAEFYSRKQAPPKCGDHLMVFAARSRNAALQSGAPVPFHASQSLYQEFRAFAWYPKALVPSEQQRQVQ